MSRNVLAIFPLTSTYFLYAFLSKKRCIRGEVGRCGGSRGGEGCGCTASVILSTLVFQSPEHVKSTVSSHNRNFE